jgi:hypothetical protein
MFQPLLGLLTDTSVTNYLTHRHTHAISLSLSDLLLDDDHAVVVTFSFVFACVIRLISHLFHYCLFLLLEPIKYNT